MTSAKFTPFAAALALALAGSAHADTQVSISWKGADTAGTKVASFLNINGSVQSVTSASYSATALSYVDDKGASFLAYCIEPEASNARKGTFQLYTASAMDTSSGTGKLLEGLYSSHFAGLSSYDQKAAFQVAVWEIVRENSGTLNATSGKFFVANTTSASVVSLANSFLADAQAYAGPSQFKLTQYTNGKYQDLVVAQAVPEPQTYAMFLAGLGAVGLMARRRLRR